MKLRQLEYQRWFGLRRARRGKSPGTANRLYSLLPVRMMRWQQQCLTNWSTWKALFGKKTWPPNN